jgi:hypothetical protein
MKMSREEATAVEFELLKKDNFPNNYVYTKNLTEKNLVDIK